MRRRGFTFVEVTAAIVIGSFVTLVAVGALKSISDGNRTVRAHSEMAAEMRFVTDRVRSDLENLYREKQANLMKLEGGVQMLGDAEQGSLIFYTLLHEKARALEPEGEVYEVEYGLMEGEDKTIFTRRVWPNPDEEADPGGVLTILSDRIVDFRVRFLTEQEWVDQWSTEESRMLPDLIEVQIVGQLDEQHKPVVSNFMINYAHGGGEMEVLSGGGEGNTSGSGNASGSGDASGGGR
jgi:type II secretion system protein J